MFIDPNRYELASDAARIQAAVDEARASGGAVRIPRINARTNEPLWEIDTAIELHSGSVVYLDNCHLRLADGVFCNIFKNSHARTPQGLTPAGRQYDIRILGLGNAVLDGGNHNACRVDQRNGGVSQHHREHFRTPAQRGAVCH